MDKNLSKEELAELGTKSLSEVIDQLKWYEAVRALNENEPYHLLAEMPIGLYITTNFDSFMYTALRQDKPNARREQPRWVQTDVGSPQYVLPYGKDNPVVFHLNGYDVNSDHIVLSEDDFMAHLVGLAHGDQIGLLPTNLLTALARNSLIFVGFKLDDWEFRVILQGLLRGIKHTGDNSVRHVGVQLDVDSQLELVEVADGNTVQQEDQAKQIKKTAQSYLEKYLSKFQIDVYWGEAQQFVADLHDHWTVYKESI